MSSRSKGAQEEAKEGEKEGDDREKFTPKAKRENQLRYFYATKVVTFTKWPLTTNTDKKTLTLVFDQELTGLLLKRKPQ